MNDTEIKVLIALIGIVSALLGAIASMIVFFWIEGRRRYLSQLAGSRVLVLIAESVHSALRNGRKDVSELKLDWVLQHLDGVFKDETAFNILRNLIDLRSELLSERANGADLATLINKADRLKISSENNLQSHLTRWRRRWYLVPR